MKVYALIANGTEEVECLAAVDVLKRAGAQVALVSAEGETVITSHKIKITADTTLSKADMSDGDVIFVPGGMPGSATLGKNKRLVAALTEALRRGARVAAICAAPALVLGANGFLNGVKATCYPGFEDMMGGAIVQKTARVVTDGKITTARGLGCAIDLGLELVRLLYGESKAEEIKNSIQY